ncbi:MAG: CAP domain-containing protein, partial [Anaerolineae bacterium]|nr:CAP domain-containing protein [Anaerolineae bacterium]
MKKFWQSLAMMLVIISMIVLVTHAQDDVNRLLLNAINTARQDEGLFSLVSNPLLQQAAQRHSDDMAATETLSHMGSDGSQFWERIHDTGYVLVSGAENVLSRGDTDAQAAFQQWYESTPHRENILNPRYTEAGIAYAQSTNGVYYFTLVLAVSTQPPVTQTPLPTSTLTATPTEVLPSVTPTMRPTDVIAATIIAPLPTNTTAPIVPTNTPIVASLSTSTPSPTPLPP